jgi:hypothetical protein
VKLRDALEAISTNGQPAQVFSQPIQTADGATIIVVSKVRGKFRPSQDGPHQEIVVRAKPVGVFVIRGGDVKWEPAVDATRVALMGELIGLVAATLATAAMVRRPPWPDIKQWIF